MSERCHGRAPLTSKRFALLDALKVDPSTAQRLVATFGSPLHLLHPPAMDANAAELHAAAAAHDLPVRLFFARKANKSISLMQRALELGLGVDVASLGELEQAVGVGARGDDLIVTAAVKPPALLRRAFEVGACVALDHPQEVDAWCALATGTGAAPRPVALRLAPDLPGRLPTRFGMAADAMLGAARRSELAGAIHGVQFHVDGYAVRDRVEAAFQALALIDALRELGHPVRFLDLGGGVPMRYVDDAAQWEGFWAAHRAALLDPQRPSVTFRGHGLGLMAVDRRIVGTPSVYPVAQQLVRCDWLDAVLGGVAPGGGETLAAALRRRGLRLHLEPGRALVDGCGVTIAAVAFTKQAVDGAELVGLEMNRTQVRSAADDFLVDPIVLRPPGGPPDGGTVDAHLVGAFCVERELLTWRTLTFPRGIAPGDLVVFPNTAGYLMHIVESASHGMPLASNVVVRLTSAGELEVVERDAADGLSLVRPSRTPSRAGDVSG